MEFNSQGFRTKDVLAQEQPEQQNHCRRPRSPDEPGDTL